MIRPGTGSGMCGLAVDGDQFRLLRRLTGVSRALTNASSFEEVARLATESAAELMRAPRALFLLADDEGSLRVHASTGAGEEALDGFRCPLDERAPERLGARFQLPGAGLGFIGVPVIIEGVVRGVLAVVRPDEPGCGEQEEWLLGALADQAAVAWMVTAAEAEAREVAERRLEEMGGDLHAGHGALAMLSHDVRAPLHTIELFAGVLLEGMHGPLSAAQADAVQKIRLGGRHLLALLRDGLGDGVVEDVVGGSARPVLASAAAEEAVTIALAERAGKGRAVERSGSDFEVLADPDRLRQVLVNLLSNALKHGGDGAEVRVRTCRGEGTHAGRGVIEVVDTGPGIPLREQERIFLPYVRGARRGGTGSGMGLAICRSVVQRLGGALELESRPGEGARFRVILPLA